MGKLILSILGYISVISLIWLSCGYNTHEPQTRNSLAYTESLVATPVVNEKMPQKEEEGEMIGKIRLIPFDKNDLPKETKYEGNIYYGVKFKDLNGENILILTATNITEHQKKSDDRVGRHRELYGYLFLKKEGKYDQVWKFQDDIQSCELDIVCDFVANSLAITDLDDDGLAEASFLYRLGCRGDVSPSNQKLLMYEDGKKYAMRGNATIKWETNGKKHKEGGDYKFDENMQNAPKSFALYAQERWSELGEESF